MGQNSGFTCFLRSFPVAILQNVNCFSLYNFAGAQWGMTFRVLGVNRFWGVPQRKPYGHSHSIPACQTSKKSKRQLLLNGKLPPPEIEGRMKDQRELHGKAVETLIWRASVQFLRCSHAVVWFAGIPACPNPRQVFDSCPDLLLAKSRCCRPFPSLLGCGMFW